MLDSEAIADSVAIGPLQVSPPVVLAPMAGVTNRPFRALCRSFGGALYVSEMVSAKALRMGDPKSWSSYVDFAPDESPRSLQLYGSDPEDVGEAVTRLVAEDRVDHLDLNFGCPAAKITRKGGGAAIPVKPKLLAAVIRAAVRAAGPVPVTMKMRTGVDDHLLTYLDAGRIAEDEGCAAVALHGRTAAQLYDGEADWSAIAKLKSHVRSIPVLGNGDIWTAQDAVAMMRQTGCDGVVVGRGCLGRPWLFADLDRRFAGEPAPPSPPFAVVRAVMEEHLRMLIEWRIAAPQRGAESYAIREFRKHMTWYTKGYRSSREVRSQVGTVDTLADLAALLDRFDPESLPSPGTERLPRAKSSGRQRVALPEGYLDDLDDATPPDDDGRGGSGG